MRFPRMSLHRIGAALGAAWMGAYVVLVLGIPPLDAGAIALTLSGVGFGAVVGTGLALAAGHLRRGGRFRRWVVIVLAAVAVLAFGRHEHRRQATARTLPTADSTWAEVLGHNAFGNALLLITHPDGDRGRMVAPRKLAHRRLEAGDSIRAYFAPGLGLDGMDVWPAGPDWPATLRMIAWVSVGVLVVAGIGAGGVEPRRHTGAGDPPPAPLAPST